MSGEDHQFKGGNAAALLRAQTTRLVPLISGLEPKALRRPTALPDWEVRHLIAHLYRDYERLLLAEPAGEEPDADDISYWRSYDPAENRKRTTSRAEQILSERGASLVVAYLELMDRAVVHVRSLSPDLVVRTWGPVMRLDDFVLTRVVEATVHGFDLAVALGEVPRASPGAIAYTAAVLDRLNDHGPRVGHDAREWIDKATGRAPLNKVDLVVLGADRASRFPLLR